MVLGTLHLSERYGEGTAPGLGQAEGNVERHPVFDEIETLDQVGVQT